MAHWPHVRAFRAIDTDDDGVITAAELNDFLKGPKSGSLNPKGMAERKQIVALLKQARPQKTGGYTEKRVSFFDALDTNSDKQVTLQEFLQVRLDRLHARVSAQPPRPSPSPQGATKLSA